MARKKQKLCRGCNTPKDVSNFPKDKSKPDGHTSRCLKCKVDYNRGWRAAVRRKNVVQKVEPKVTVEHVFNRLSG